MTITATCITKSVNFGKGGVAPNPSTLITVEARYPRFIHAEVMTHRAFCRNASSSRAIPTQRQLAAVWEDMAEPIEWGSNKPGMQAGEELKGWKKWLARSLWRFLGLLALGFAWCMWKLGAHKQIVNRVIEPWSHIIVVITATEWSNFFALRLDSGAQPEIRELARAILHAIDTTPATVVLPGEWHLSYVTGAEDPGYFMADVNTGVPPAAKISAARCARTSYRTHDGRVPEAAEDFALFEKLVGDRIKHASPTEHQAVALDDPDVWCRNLRGWRMHRDFIPGETL